MVFVGRGKLWENTEQSIKTRWMNHHSLSTCSFCGYVHVFSDTAIPNLPPRRHWVSAFSSLVRDSSRKPRGRSSISLATSCACPSFPTMHWAIFRSGFGIREDEIMGHGKQKFWATLGAPKLLWRFPMVSMNHGGSRGSLLVGFMASQMDDW